MKKGSLIINLLLGLSVFLFTFGQIGRFAPFPVPVYGNAYEIPLFIATVLLIFMIKFPSAFRKSIFIQSVGFFFLWLCISLGISVFYYQPVQNMLAVLYLIRLFLYFLFFIYFSHYLKKNTAVVSFYLKIIVFAAVLIIIFSCVQYFLYQNLGNLAYAGWDPHLYRLVGLFFDPPVTAAVFFLLGLFILVSFQNVVLKWVFITIFMILFFLTYSRGGFLALFATLIVFSIRKMKFIYLAGFLILTAMIFILFPRNLSEGLNLARTTSIKTRLTDYRKAVKIWEKSPVIGIGYNHIRAEKDSYEEEPITETYNPSHASASFHSSFLMILVTSGVIGLLLYLLVLVKIARMGAFAFYSIIFLSVYSFTDNLFLHPFILFLTFMLISIIHPSDTQQ